MADEERRRETERGAQSEGAQERRMQSETGYRALCDLNLTGGLETAPVPGDSPLPPFTPSATPRHGYSTSSFDPPPPPPPPLTKVHFSKAQCDLFVLAICSLSPYLAHGLFVLDRPGE